MDKVVKLFEKAMGMGAPSLNIDFRDVSIGPEEADDTPEDEDVAIWREANKEMRDRAFPYIERLSKQTDSPRIRFFGDMDAADYFMREYEDDPDGVLNSYYEWLVFDFRRGKKSETIAEKILKEEDLPERAREMIEAKAAGWFSVFRFEEMLEDNTVKLLDIVSGDEVVVYEPLKWRTPLVLNMCIPAKIARLGKYNFMGQMGPQIDAMEAMYCLELLEEKGMELTREGMKKRSYLFGRSWDWKEAVRETLDDMEEYSEDDIFQAVYDVADETAARKAVEAIPEINRVDDGFYDWLEEPQKEPDEYIEAIGYLSFREGRLNLAAWSEDDFDFMIGELENIPGITLKTTAVNPEDEESEDDEMDDAFVSPDDEGFGDGVADHERVEPVTTAEKKVESNIADAAGDEELDSKLSAIPEAMKPAVRNYLRVISEWSDSEHPLLDGITPRKLSRTSDGKVKVARMIRAMPHFIAISSNEEDESIIIKAPREEMMKTMGLE